MTGTDKQIKYAESLKAQTVGEFNKDIEVLSRLVSQYTARQNETGQDYTEKIKAKQARIDAIQRKIDALNAIDEAGDLIDAIKYRRPSIFWNI